MLPELPHWAANDTVVRIRPWHPDDIPAFLEATDASRADLARWMAWHHPNFGWRDAAGYVLSRPSAWSEQSEYSFAIIDLADERILGDIALNRVDAINRVANIGYWIRSDATGRGHASRALRMIRTFAFRHLHLERLEIVAAVDNLPSRRVAERAGATLEGIMARRLRLHDEQLDAALYALLPASRLRIESEPMSNPSTGNESASSSRTSPAA